MAWRETLQELRSELSEIRAQRDRERREDEKEQEAQRAELVRLAESMRIRTLLEEMNNVLLDGRGQLESSLSWEEEDEEDSDLPDDLFMMEYPADFDDADCVTSILSWDEGGEREIAVDLSTSEEGLTLMINGIDIRPEPEALESALVEAFRDQLEL